MSGDFEGLWSREPTCRIECTSSADIFDKIVYTMANPVAAHLVAHGHSWPGLRGAWPHKPRTISRPRGFFRDQERGGDWPETATLTFHRPPGYDALSDAELASSLEQAIERRETSIRENARASGKRFLGRRGVLTQSRYAFPKSGEQRFRTRPTFAARSRWARIERIRQDRAWLDAYQAATVRLRAGIRDVLFPYGTYKLRLYYRLACEPPPT